MLKLSYGMLVILMNFFIFSASAASPDCTVEKSRVGPFIESFEEVNKVVQVLCKDKDKHYSTQELDSLTNRAMIVANLEANIYLKSSVSYVEGWFGPVWQYDETSTPPTKLIFPERRFNTIGDYSFFAVNGEANKKVKNDVLMQCQNDYKCVDLFKNLEYLLNRLTQPVRDIKLSKTIDYLSSLNTEWDNFGKEARSQTFLDIIVTTAFYEKNDNYHDNFQPPPERQFFALHPTLIIENVPAALDGDELDEAIAIEIFGINYWRGAKLCGGLPCGVSLIGTYSDRAGVEESGWGFMFHLDNKYSFGVTKHSGDVGVFFTLDLLKLFEDKKTQINKVKNSIQEKFK